MTRKVLLVDDDPAVRNALSQTLELGGLEPVPASAFIVAKDHINAGFDGVVVSDIRMPGKDGFHLLAHARTVDPDLPVILLTGEGDIPMAVRAMAEGAFGFLEKPCDSNDLMGVLERALKTRSLVLENRRLRQMMRAGDPAARMIFGISDLAEGLRARVRNVAQSDADVLVTGPPGSGVSKIAEIVHLTGQRSQAPFVKHAAAALTAKDVSAALEAAQHGTLFVEELTLLSPQVQMVLTEQLDAARQVRLIGGSTQDIAASVAEGRLNSDLYYRLEGVTIRIPALAERPEDIPVLFRQYVALASEQSGQPAPEITPEVVGDLMAQDWPGNARALMSAAMRFVMGVGEEQAMGQRLGLAEQMAQVESSILQAALRRAHGQASAAAEALKLPRKTFYDKLARYGIKPESYRP